MATSLVASRQIPEKLLIVIQHELGEDLYVVRVSEWSKEEADFVQRHQWTEDPLHPTSFETFLETFMTLEKYEVVAFLHAELEPLLRPQDHSFPSIIVTEVGAQLALARS
jgi:hypothetical protein